MKNFSNNLNCITQQAHFCLSLLRCLVAAERTLDVRLTTPEGTHNLGGFISCLVRCAPAFVFVLFFVTKGSLCCCLVFSSVISCWSLMSTSRNHANLDLWGFPCFPSRRLCFQDLVLNKKTCFSREIPENGVQISQDNTKNDNHACGNHDLCTYVDHKTQGVFKYTLSLRQCPIGKTAVVVSFSEEEMVLIHSICGLKSARSKKCTGKEKQPSGQSKIQISASLDFQALWTCTGSIVC